MVSDVDTKIDEIIELLSLPLDAAEAADGWVTESKEIAKRAFEQIRDDRQKGIALKPMNIFRVLDSWGVTKGSLLKKVAIISNELSRQAG